MNFTLSVDFQNKLCICEVFYFITYENRYKDDVRIHELKARQ